MMGQISLTVARVGLLLVITQLCRQLSIQQQLAQPLPELLRGHQALAAQVLLGLFFLPLAQRVHLAAELAPAAQDQGVIYLIVFLAPLTQQADLFHISELLQINRRLPGCHQLLNIGPQLLLVGVLMLRAGAGLAQVARMAASAASST
jgi:hypothetical protein